MFPADIIGPDLIIIIVVAVIVLLFGGSKLPRLARGLGSASHEFKKGLAEGDAEQQNGSQAAAVPPQQAPAAPISPPAPPAPPAVPAPPPIPQAQPQPTEQAQSGETATG
ncbi:MAG: twin-arginine translocase TatA/TatE family subunit [Actinomycetota bacterium]|nr:twin-arginine translocase TatA/TatE family subunit [Actinomycetota bacterium]